MVPWYRMRRVKLFQMFGASMKLNGKSLIYRQYRPRCTCCRSPYQWRVLKQDIMYARTKVSTIFVVSSTPDGTSRMQCSTYQGLFYNVFERSRNSEFCPAPHQINYNRCEHPYELCGKGWFLHLISRLPSELQSCLHDARRICAAPHRLLRGSCLR